MESGAGSAILSLLWIAALWYSAALFTRGTDAVDRLRTAIVLGIAIPGVLGFCGLLYPATLWIAAAALALLRRIRVPKNGVQAELGLYATLAATLVVIWPALCRPLLDGDSLEYHLPNASAWLQLHSVWNASAPYWYYPPGSELFAAGVLGAAGRWSLPLCGALPALLLTARLYRIGRSAGASPTAAAAMPLAFIFTPVAAFQSGTLQNDLWLAAFFLEVLALQGSAAAAMAVCALIKPIGFIDAAIAAAIARRPLRSWCIAALPLLVWYAHDALLLARSPLVPIAPQPPYWMTTIASDLRSALPALTHGIAVHSPQSYVWLAAGFAGLFFSRTRRYAIAGIITALLYLFLPVSYRSYATNYAMDASSVRYLLPALACGAAVAQIAAARAPVIVPTAAYSLAASGAVSVLAVYWNDAHTRVAPLLALVLAILVLVPRRFPVWAPVLLAILIAGAIDAEQRAPSFYAEWMRARNGAPTGGFRWIAEHRPPRIAAVNLRTGAVLMNSPRTRTFEVAGDVCRFARDRDALLVVGRNEDATEAQLQSELARARACGTVLFEDGAALIVRPGTSS
jgi:hypothetical protein